jgi:pyruvate formate lyase activating enzyme
MKKAMIFDVVRGSFVDGPGIRTTVFFKGCNLKCKWCHNPESQSFKQQILYYKNKCAGCNKCKTICPHNFEYCDFCGKCALFCPNDARELCGKEYTVDEVLVEILKDKNYYGETGGVTFSVGECMLQVDFLLEILKKCKENGIYTAVDTAGNVPWEYFLKILPYVDLFLYDVKCITEKLHIEGTGATNKLILENLKNLSQNNKNLLVRIPIIPNFNLDLVELKKVKNYLDCIVISKIEVLPYHSLGENKWKALGKEPIKYSVPKDEDVRQIKQIFYKE